MSITCPPCHCEYFYLANWNSEGQQQQGGHMIIIVISVKGGSKAITVTSLLNFELNFCSCDASSPS